MTEAPKDPAGHDEHPAHLAHHFETAEQQYESGKLGMWIFLVTEILLFGGLFCWYSVYRANHPEVFQYAHQFLDKKLGGINTIVLICSSLTMAWAVRAAQLGKRSLLLGMLALTFLFACGFLGIKYVEYRHKWHEGLLWGKHYHYQHEAEAAGGSAAGTGGAAEEGPAGDAGAEGAAAGEDGDDAEAEAMPAGANEGSNVAPAAVGPEGLAPPASGEGGHGKAPNNVFLFFGIYFVMTGLHGVHVIAGMAVIAWLFFRAKRGDFSPEYYIPVDVGGLYWHLVDLVWIFLFPLLYLIH